APLPSPPRRDARRPPGAVRATRHRGGSDDRPVEALLRLGRRGAHRARRPGGVGIRSRRRRRGAPRRHSGGHRDLHRRRPRLRPHQPAAPGPGAAAVPDRAQAARRPEAPRARRISGQRPYRRPASARRAAALDRDLGGPRLHLHRTGPRPLPQGRGGPPLDPPREPARSLRRVPHPPPAVPLQALDGHLDPAGRSAARLRARPRDPLRAASGEGARGSRAAL
ncbi:MAG: hypothetical protein AVDCRST_MAG69-85, partial [uncultured Solirubrobacteraceae bacterium]